MFFEFYFQQFNRASLTEHRLFLLFLTKKVAEVMIAKAESVATAAKKAAIEAEEKKWLK